MVTANTVGRSSAISAVYDTATLWLWFQAGQVEYGLDEPGHQDRTNAWPSVALRHGTLHARDNEPLHVLRNARRAVLPTSAGAVEALQPTLFFAAGGALSRTWRSSPVCIAQK